MYYNPFIINSLSKKELDELKKDFYIKLLSIKSDEESQKKLTLEESFKNELKPGRIIELDIKGDIHFGIMLSNKVAIYMNDKGNIKGYLSNFTINTPYKINKIYIPTDDAYQLNKYKDMKVAWSRPADPVIIKKSKAEIEKELGLKPGTLEIY